MIMMILSQSSVRQTNLSNNKQEEEDVALHLTMYHRCAAHPLNGFALVIPNIHILFCD